MAEPGSGRESSSGSTSAERELDAALDGFEVWARREGPVPTPRLPPLAGWPDGSPVGTGGDRLGDYRLVRRLGVGGMGVVFEARQLSVGGRRVAVKVLRSVFATAAARERFRREVETIAALDHPAIVPIADARVDGEVPYYVMRYVEGASAARLVHALREAGELRPTPRTLRRAVDHLAGHEGGPREPASDAWESSHPRWVAAVGLQLAEALAYAHGRGVVHRDVKPGNVLLTRHGHAVLVDFGLASIDGAHSLTGTGQFVGTLRYAAPEQVRGLRAGAAADVYSLGLTLYELLALRHPFVPDSDEPLRRTGDEVAQPLDRELPEDLCTILQRALAVEPRRRFPSAAALADDLRAFLAHRPIRARRAGVLERALRGGRRHPRTVAFAAATALTAAGILAWREHAAGRATALGLERLELAHAAQERIDALRGAYLAAQDARPPDHRARQALRRELLDARRLADDLLAQAEQRLLAATRDQVLTSSARRGLARLEAERLRGALAAGLDVLRPDEVETLEAALARDDREGTFAELIDPVGTIELRATPGASVPGTIVRVVDPRAPDRPVFRGPLPHPLALPAGLYLARVEGSDASLPFLVRRAAAEPGPRVVLVGDAEEGPDLDPAVLGQLVHVPAGRALVERDPAVWQDVDAFWIGRFELSEGRVASWRARLAERTSGHSMGLGFTPSPDERSRLPARSLTPMDMSGLLQALELVHPLPPDWTYDLPTRAEWIRAARGETAQAWPFGERFDWSACVNFYSASSYPGEASPEVVGHAPRDRSPLGVHDLAGSVAEVTSELLGPLPGAYVVCGGSFRSLEEGELAIDHVDHVANEPRPDVGFRLVVRRTDPWFRQPDLAPRPFRDDFERADDTELGGEWLERLGLPGSLPTQIDFGQGAEIAGGRLVCRGGVGHFSESTDVWHRVHLGDGDFRLRLRARGFVDAAWRDTDQTRRQVSLSLFSDSKVTTCREIALRVSGRGETRLYWRDGLATGEQAGAEVPFEALLDYELVARGPTLEATVRMPDGETALATIRMERPGGFVPRYLALRAPPLIGAGLAIEAVEIGPLPPAR